jgi:hypothetical protein
VGFDAVRSARIAAMKEVARPIWEQAGDTDALQQFLKDNGCHGVEAVFVTMGLLDCDLGEAQRADSVEGRRHLLVASLVWGSGTKARTVDRRAQIFTGLPAADIDARLALALDVLRSRGAVEAYRAFNNDQRIRFLGPAFFTKVLYFAGHDAGNDPRPVILDSVVTRALRACGDVDAAWRDNGWTTPQYERYLEAVRAYAALRKVLPDQVEAALFACGK